MSFWHSTQHRVAIVVACLTGAAALPARADEFDMCGELFAGLECMLFAADNGLDYVLYPPNFGGFGVGDRVRVVGDEVLGCPNNCMQGNGCIYNPTVTACYNVCATYTTTADFSTGEFINLTRRTISCRSTRSPKQCRRPRRSEHGLPAWATPLSAGNAASPQFPSVGIAATDDSAKAACRCDSWFFSGNPTFC